MYAAVGRPSISRCRVWVLLSVLVGLALLAAACGDDGDSRPAAQTSVSETVRQPVAVQPERPGYHELELATGTATPIGEGARQVWVLRPFGDVRSIVIFLHGWTATLPVQWHQPWLEHLMAKGSIVLFPRYQSGILGEDVQYLTVEAMRKGLEAGFADLGDVDGLPVLVAGFSHGGSLAFSYTANAEAWGFPVPEAVYSIFPARPARLPLPEPPPDSVKVLLLVGDRDRVVGSVGADIFWEWLAPLPHDAKEYRVIRSTPGFPIFHEALKWMPQAIDVFWKPFDKLVDKAVEQRTTGVSQDR